MVFQPAEGGRGEGMMRADEQASLEKEIDETRADVRATLEALEQKLSPGQMLDHVMALLRRHGGDYAEAVTQAAKDNPVATLLTTMGLAWLLTAARPEERRDGGNGRLPSEAEVARRQADALVPTSGRRSWAQRGRSGLDRFIHEQPLVVGAIGVAVGAIIGAALKSSNGAGYLDDLLEEAEEAQAAAAAATAEPVTDPRGAVPNAGPASGPGGTAAR